MTDETKEILIEQMDSMRAELMKAHEAIGSALILSEELTFEIDAAMDIGSPGVRNRLADVIAISTRLRNALKRV